MKARAYVMIFFFWALLTIITPTLVLWSESAKLKSEAEAESKSESDPKGDKKGIHNPRKMIHEDKNKSSRVEEARKTYEDKNKSSKLEEGRKTFEDRNKSLKVEEAPKTVEDIRAPVSGPAPEPTPVTGSENGSFTSLLLKVNEIGEHRMGKLVTKL